MPAGPCSCPALLRGGTMLVLNGFEPVKVMQAIQEYKHQLHAGRADHDLCAARSCPRLDEFDLSSLETIFYGASAISPARLKEAIERIGPVFAQFYGQAEAPMCDHDIAQGRARRERPAPSRQLRQPSPWVRVELQDSQAGPSVTASQERSACRARWSWTAIATRS
jgi:fatty-acyl-CoA synthase